MASNVYRQVKIKRFAVDLSIDLWEDMRKQAEKLGMSRKDYILKAIEERILKDKNRGG